MQSRLIWQQLRRLPPPRQEQVADFIDFLVSRDTESPGAMTKPKRRLSEEPFVGMWKGRRDMRNASAWVNRLRQREWDR